MIHFLKAIKRPTPQMQMCPLQLVSNYIGDAVLNKCAALPAFFCPSPSARDENTPKSRIMMRRECVYEEQRARCVNTHQFCRKKDHEQDVYMIRQFFVCSRKSQIHLLFRHLCHS